MKYHLFLYFFLLWCHTAFAGGQTAKEKEAYEKFLQSKYSDSLKLYKEVARDEKADPEARERASAMAVEMVLQVARRNTDVLGTTYAIKQDYLKEIQLSPANQYILFEYGGLLSYLEEYTAAADAYAASMYYGHKKAAPKLAFLYRKLKQYDQSIAIYQIALQSTPGVSRLWAELGDVYFITNDFSKAEETYSKAMVLGFNTKELVRQYATTLSRLERFDEAIAQCEMLIKMAQDASHRREIEILSAYSWVATIYADAGQLQQAIYYLKRAEELAITLGISPAEYLNNLAWYICITKQKSLQTPELLEEAYRLAAKAVELSKRQKKEYLDTQAEAAYLLGRYQEAIDLETEAIKFDRSHPFYASQLAKYKEAQRNAPLLGEPITD